MRRGSIEATTLYCHSSKLLFLQMLFEANNKKGKLDPTHTQVESRTPAEIFMTLHCLKCTIRNNLLIEPCKCTVIHLSIVSINFSANGCSKISNGKSTAYILRAQHLQIFSHRRLTNHILHLLACKTQGSLPHLQSYYHLYKALSTEPSNWWTANVVTWICNGWTMQMPGNDVLFLILAAWLTSVAEQDQNHFNNCCFRNGFCSWAD